MDAPIHPVASNDDFPIWWFADHYGAGYFDTAWDDDGNTIWYAENGAFASDEGAGTHGIGAGADHENAWYGAYTALASDEGAFSSDVASGANGNDAWYGSEWAAAYDEGAASFGVASGADHDNAWWSTDGAFADDEGADAFGTASGAGHNYGYPDAWYLEYYGDDVVYHDDDHVLYDHDDDILYADEDDVLYHDHANLVADGTFTNSAPASDMSLVHPHTVKESPSVPTMDHGVMTAPTTHTAQRPTAMPARPDRPALAVAEPHHFSATYHESGVIAGDDAIVYDVETSAGDVDVDDDDDDSDDDDSDDDDDDSDEYDD